MNEYFQELIYGFGLVMLLGNFRDVSKSIPTIQLIVWIDLALTVISSIGFLVFFIWGFFKFSWGVPIIAPIICGLIYSFIKYKIINSPRVDIILGLIMCLYVFLFIN